ncbi:hypothetical protein BC749_104157 [Flavobacterium araucananum]|uniref:Uncharacterized protein n=1 Tax=Flavobacterium araucananum TaxID=946678 RepID=A0A227PEV0_9FLAO|nr:hypothetical protein [Flavobacterium araucananum]OXG08450.1 hypothetical protein B0A64_06745 [Flavobacterium araucananum]PWJ99010.1 hypothetical protein BC749_104157 [Flavobacterium araucananum]
MKNLFLSSMVAIIGLTGYAQETAPETKTSKEPSRLNFNIGLETSHLWRGLIINPSMTITADIHYALDKKQNFTVGFWGGNGFDGKYTEVDYYVQYKHKGLTVGLWDLFNTTNVIHPEVFNYDKNTTTHLIDLRSSYRFSPQFPLRVEADIILYGNDRELNSDLVYKNRYSTYVELGYPLLKNEQITLDAYVGTSFSLDGKSNLYTTNPDNSLNVVNTGLKASKDITILQYKLPVYAGIMWNPAEKYTRMQLGVSLF